MSTSLLYHGFGVRGYQYVRARYKDGGVVFGIERPREQLRCSHCQSANVHLRGSTDRTFRCLPIGGKPVFVEYSVPRLYCWDCHTMRQPDLVFADPKKHNTRAFERYALELSRLTTIQDAARHLDISWDTMKEIQRRHLEKNYAQPKLRNLARRGIGCVPRPAVARHPPRIRNPATRAPVLLEGCGGAALRFART